MLPFLRKNHHVPIPYFQQLHMRDDIIKKQVCVQPLALTAHRQWGKPSASFFHSLFSLSQLQGDVFCHNRPAAGASCTEREVSGFLHPSTHYASSKDQDAAGQAGADGALCPMPTDSHGGSTMTKSKAAQKAGNTPVSTSLLECHK